MYDNPGLLTDTTGQGFALQPPPPVADEETRRRLMMQVGLPAIGAHMGAALLAAAQGGQAPGLRAHYMGQAAMAPAVGMEATARAEQAQQEAANRNWQQRFQTQQLAMQGRMQNAQISEIEARAREREQQAAFWRGGTAGGEVGVGEGGTFSEGGLARLFARESSGNPNARSGTSTAGGLGQFTEGTWLMFARDNPQLFQGMDRNQILAARFGEIGQRLSPIATQWYARRNAPHLQQAGVPVNDVTLAMAHMFDGPVAARIATANPATPIDQIVSPAAMAANANLRGKTAGDVVSMFRQQMIPTGPSRGEQVLAEMGVPEDIRRAVMALPNEQRAAAIQQIVQSRMTPRTRQIIGGERVGYYELPPGGGAPREVIPGSERGNNGISNEIRQAEAGLRGELRLATSGFDTQQQAFMSLHRLGMDPNAMNSIATVFALFKIIDPTSTVREGEYATARNAAGVPERFISLYNRMVSGDQLTAEQRRQIMGVAADYYESAASSYERELNRFRGLAEQYGGSPDRVARDAREPELMTLLEQRRERRELVQRHQATADRIRTEYPNNLTARLEMARRLGVPEDMVR